MPGASRAFADTNLFLCFLTQDPPEQAAAAEGVLRRAEAGDTEGAARLAEEARGQAKAALDELRALSSGVAPPLLQDRGLAAALSALALRT